MSTELERVLQKQLKQQQEIFTAELKKIGREYEESLNQTMNDYEQTMSAAWELINQQKKTLSRYEEISTNWEVALDEKQLQSLEDSFQLLMEGLDEQEKPNSDLLEQLNAWEDRLSELEKSNKDLLEQLNALLGK